MRQSLCSVVASLAWIAAAGSTAGCLTPAVQLDGSQGQDLGRVAIAAGPLGQVDLAPSSCASGARQFFLGADFTDPREGLTVRLVIDPLGTEAVRVYTTAAPQEQSVVFFPSDCDVLDYSLDSNGWFINDVEDLRVSLELDCTDEDGRSVKGKLQAPHCH